jgi:microcystin-dependent protein
MSVVNSFTSGTTIASADVNANFSDIASEITNSVAKDGQTSMTGPLKAATGSAAAPGITFASDTDTGLYRKSANVIGVAAGGSEVATIGTTGILDANSNVVVGIPVGAVMMFGATTAPTGWVRMNGRTIGNASSSATERANADTSALFEFLWTNYSNSVCAVSTGRGATAAADYAANKTIALPSMRGRAPFGLDDMGNSAASVLTSATITGPTTNGASGGAEAVTLDSTQIPSHSHAAGTLAADSGGAHTHDVKWNSAGDTSTSGGGARSTGPNSGGSQTAAAAAVSGGAHVHTISGSTGLAGSSGGHTNLPPAFLTTFIIKL